MWEVEVERTKALAVDANEFIEKLTVELTRYAFNDCTERMLVVLPLLKSAIDMGAAATRIAFEARCSLAFLSFLLGGFF